METMKKCASTIESLRTWARTQVRDANFCKIIVGMFLGLKGEISQKCDNDIFELLLNLGHIDQFDFSILIERVEREAWDELLVDTNSIICMIEELTHLKQTGQLLPSDFMNSLINIEQNFERDLRGVECPRNYVKASVILKKLPAKSKLKLLLDSGMPIENVPMRLKADGYSIVERIKIEGHWSITVIKGNERLTNA